MDHPCIAVILSGSVLIPSSETTWPRNLTDLWKRTHFEGFSFRLASHSLVKTCSSRSSSRSIVGAGTIMSSMYRRHSDHWRPLRTSSISLSKTDGLVPKPNGVTVNWYSPWLVENAVFSRSLGSRPIWKNPWLRSRQLNHFEPFKESRHSSTWGRGYASWIMTWLTAL